jgi:cell division protein FtsB
MTLMWREMRRRLRVLVMPVIGIALTGYFGYSLVEGNRGLSAWVRLNKELHAAQDTLAAVSAERQTLEHRVSHMRPDHVDPDLLDTQVRKTLDLASPDEIVIINSFNSPSAAAPQPVPAAPPRRAE